MSIETQLYDTEKLIHETTGEGEHLWESSTGNLRLVAGFWKHVWPWACVCGALKNWDGIITESKRNSKGNQHDTNHNRPADSGCPGRD